MTREMTPTLHCDGDDGFCSESETDYYAVGAVGIDDVRMTSTTRAPGWHSTGDTDLCPEHAARPRTS